MTRKVDFPYIISHFSFAIEMIMDNLKSRVIDEK